MTDPHDDRLDLLLDGVEYAPAPSLLDVLLSLWQLFFGDVS